MLDTSHPFTTVQARAAGIDRAALAGPRFRQVMKGVHVSASRGVTRLVRIEAGLATHPPGAFASHTSAAAVYGLPVPHSEVEHVSVTGPNDRRRRPSVRSHVRPGEPLTCMVRGIRVSAPTQLFVELASMLTLVDLIVVGDALVRAGRCTPAQLVEATGASPGRTEVRATRAAAYVRDGVDSPMETRLRMLIVLAGLPEPEVNFKVRDEHGNVIRRYDLSYPSLRLIIEYDGRQHAETASQYARDRDRREEIDLDDWHLTVVTSEGVYVDPRRTLVRVRAALQRHGARGLRRTFDRQWERHFPSRV